MFCFPKVGAIWTDRGTPSSSSPKNIGSNMAVLGALPPGQENVNGVQQGFSLLSEISALHPVRDTGDTFVGSKWTKHKDI